MITLTHERTEVLRSAIKAGDFIEVEYRGPDYAKEEVTIYRGVVVENNSLAGRINTESFHFRDSVVSHTFYRLPQPAPVEPKGLGAVVELTNEDGEPRLIVRVHGWDLWQDEDGDEMGWGSWMTYAHGQAKVLREGYNA